MSFPRRVLPETTYFITRRIHGRRFLLRPDKSTRHLILYCLALAAERYRISVRSLCIMSNHYHLVITDNRGMLPLFLQYFHRLVALGVQKQRGWDEVVWEPNRQTSAVELLNPEAILQQTLYLVTNPVSAGITVDPASWPGTFVKGAYDLDRPACFDRGRLPKRARLVFRSPRESESDFLGELDAHLPAAVEEARSARESGRFLGTRRALATPPESFPRTQRRKGQMSPRLAAASQKVLRQGIIVLRLFREAYRDARERLRRGLEALLPAGAWQPVRRFGLACEVHSDSKASC